MAFNLKKVLKAWLLSSSEPLTLKDIQGAFARYHNQPEADLLTPADGTAGEGDPRAAGDGASAPAFAGAAEDALRAETPAEEPALLPEPPEDAELYQNVPSLITAAQIREAMDEIAAELKLNDDGLLLIEGANGYRVVTHPRFGRWVRILRQEPPPVKLSQSSLETLAVVSYRQPVTRTEIETIRGVSAEAGVTKLLERELIAIVGRADQPGRPLQYGTTDKFLEFVGIKSLDELPASDVLSSRQIDEWLRTAANPTVAPSDRDMGLETEGEPNRPPEAVPAGKSAEVPGAEPANAEPSVAIAEPSLDSAGPEVPLHQEASANPEAGQLSGEPELNS
jgi:segregation and condensation protein B